jgi:hypothetical protein
MVADGPSGPSSLRIGPTWTILSEI